MTSYQIRSNFRKTFTKNVAAQQLFYPLTADKLPGQQVITGAAMVLQPEQSVLIRLIKANAPPDSLQKRSPGRGY